MNNLDYSYENSKNIIYGINTITDALTYGNCIKKIIICSDINKKNNRGIHKIITIADKRDIPIAFEEKEKINKLSNVKTHQGVLAIAKSFKYSNLITVLETNKKHNSLILLLDHIKDAGNLGAIIRTAEACGALCVVIPNKRSALVDATTYKTSAGAITNIPIVKVSNISAAIKTLKNNGFWICAASEHADEQIWDSNLKGNIGIVMGGEHEGVSELVLKNSDFCAKLPILGKVQSLNVAQACSVFCYEWVRQNL